MKGHVLSNDPDTVALLLHYIPNVIEQGHEALWLQFWTGEKRWMLQLHEFVQNQGVSPAKKATKILQSTLALNVTLLDIYQTLQEMNSLANKIWPS